MLFSSADTTMLLTIERFRLGFGFLHTALTESALTYPLFKGVAKQLFDREMQTFPTQDPEKVVFW
jgi:hypothetical protein